MRFADLTGKRFERWNVISFSHSDKDNRKYWKCKCDCGKEKIVFGGNLTQGKSKSCGCIAIEKKTTYALFYGGKRPKYYSTWSCMKDRCYNVNNSQYKDYGGRGITVCDRWLRRDGLFNFMNDMGERPSKFHTVDRINNDGNYEPSNCKWSTWEEQHSHTRKSRVLEYNGKKMIQAAWARELNMDQATLIYRLKHYSFNEVISKFTNYA